MSLPFYHFETERTYFSDDTFGAIGRALTFATDFEANCKSLSMLMDIKSRKLSLENENDFKSFLEKLGRKTRRHVFPLAAAGEEVDRFWHLTQFSRRSVSESA